MKDFAWMMRHFANKQTESNRNKISQKNIPSTSSALECTTSFECRGPGGKGLVLNSFLGLGFFSSPPALCQILEDSSSLCTPKS